MYENSELMPILPFTSSDSNRAKRTPAGRAGAILNFRSKHVHMPAEPEDARITGATRSLYRRLLALNLRKPVAAVSSLQETESYMPPLTA